MNGSVLNMAPPKKKRGRPPKIKVERPSGTFSESACRRVSKTKQKVGLPRKRGRPPKMTIERSSDASTAPVCRDVLAKLPKKRGRPPKKATSISSASRLKENAYINDTYALESTSDSIDLLFNDVLLDSEDSSEYTASALSDELHAAYVKNAGSSSSLQPLKKKRKVGRPPNTEKGAKDTMNSEPVEDYDFGLTSIVSENKCKGSEENSIELEHKEVKVSQKRNKHTFFGKMKRTSSTVTPYSAPLATNLSCLNRRIVPNCSYLQKHGSWESNGQSFKSKLLGKGEEDVSTDLIVSPYSQKALPRDIWRDWWSVPFRVRLHSELLSKVHKKPCQPPRVPLRYSYIRPEYLPAINFLASEFFWPDIDMSESLRYPECSCVALYKKVVVGFAFVTPDVSFNEYYLSFVFTLPHWRQAGIASFMLFLLIRSFPNKNISLHCGVSNPAMVLYQKLGFRIEQFLPHFYENYLPRESTDSRHAYLLRLKRS